VTGVQDDVGAGSKERPHRGLQLSEFQADKTRSLKAVRVLSGPGEAPPALLAGRYLQIPYV
jgi:hypothetical protein